MLKVTEFPVCYVLRLKEHPVYVPHTNHAFGLYEGVIKDFYKDPTKGSNWLTPKLDLAKRWSTVKKLKTAFKGYENVAQYYYIVCSDQTVIDAETLFP